MTTRARQAVTPLLDAQAMATRATSRASHAFTLAELVSDAASGHPGQRWTVTRQSADAVMHGFYLNTAATSRYIAVRASIAPMGTWNNIDGVVLDLSIRDGTNTILSSSTAIPRGLKSDYHYPPENSRGRYGSAKQALWYLDLATLRTTLTASDLWRITLDANFDGSTCALDDFQVEEVPRFLVDTSEAQGADPASFLPRGIIQDGTATGLQRLVSTARYGYFQNRRTYCSLSAPEAAPWTTTSTVQASIPALEESAGVAIKHRVRPRAMRGSAANGAKIRFGCRYKTSGADGAVLRLYSGGGSSPYDLTLPATSGAWADVTSGTGYLATNGTDGIDTLYWHAKIDAAGTLSIDHLWIVDDPA